MIVPDDVSRAAILERLEEEKAFYYHGHGHDKCCSNELYTRLLTSAGSLSPFRVSGKNLNYMYLAFLCTWMTNASEVWEEFVYNRIVQECVLSKGSSREVRVLVRN